MPRLRPSLCLTLAGALIAAAPARADTDVAPLDQPVSLIEQSRILRVRIEALRLERRGYGLGGPITMLSLGGGAVWGWLMLRADCHCSDDYGLAFLGISGAALAIIGFVSLDNHLRHRRDLANEISAKTRRLQDVEDHLHFSAILGPNNLRGAALALTF